MSVNDDEPGDEVTPGEILRRIVEIHVARERLATEIEALELESVELRERLAPAFADGQTRLFLVDSLWGRSRRAAEDRSPYMIEVYHEHGELFMEVTRMERAQDWQWMVPRLGLECGSQPAAGEPEIGSNAALIATAVAVIIEDETPLVSRAKNPS